MRARLVEAFTDESDPIKDMGIGIRERLKHYSLGGFFLESYIDALEDKLNLSRKDIYFLGGNISEDLSPGVWFKVNDHYLNTYFVEIFKELKHSSYITKINEDVGTIIFYPNANPGKVVKIISTNGTTMRYWGDFEAACKFDILNNVKLSDE